MELQVGDKIRRTNAFSNMVVEIERVTKTQAITKPYNNAGAVYKFRRKILGNTCAVLIGADKWDVTEYTLIKN